VLRASSKRAVHAILLISFLLQVAPLGAIVGRRDILHSALMMSSALNEEKEDGGGHSLTMVKKLPPARVF
jgi:hypothetical protein